MSVAGEGLAGSPDFDPVLCPLQRFRELTQVGKDPSGGLHQGDVQWDDYCTLRSQPHPHDEGGPGRRLY